MVSVLVGQTTLLISVLESIIILKADAPCSVDEMINRAIMTKKIILLIVCMLAAIGSHGQETEIDSTKVEGWKKSGLTSLIVNQTAFSNWVSGGENSIAAIRRRWKLYGKSDHEIYSRHNGEWILIRKLKSLTYPFRKEFVEPILSVNLKKSIFILPFLTFITFYRYVGWVQCSWLKK